MEMTGSSFQFSVRKSFRNTRVDNWLGHFAGLEGLITGGALSVAMPWLRFLYHVVLDCKSSRVVLGSVVALSPVAAEG